MFWLGKVRRLKDRGGKFVLAIDLYVILQSTYASAYHIQGRTYASAYHILHWGDRPTRQRIIFKADLRVSVSYFYAAKFTYASAYHIFEADLHLLYVSA